MSLARFRKSVVVAAETDSVGSAARKLRDARVGCVVVTRDKRPVGIVTDRDVTIRVVAEGRDAEQTRIGDIVTYGPFVVSEKDGIETAAACMKKHGVRRLPLVDERGTITGIVTADDLVTMLGHELSDLCEGIESGADSDETR